MPSPLWNVVLAGGAGKRLASITGGIPKQFWSAAGAPTLLEDTLDRVAPLAPPDRTLVIVDRTHEPFLAARPRTTRDAHIVHQSCSRGTAAAVLLGLTEILPTAPDATIVLTPSDHGVARPDLFVSAIRGAARDARVAESGIVLFGVVPDTPEGDYGWIVPGPAASSDRTALRPVRAFVEKPAATAVRQLFASGAVWNTMVLVARGSALLDLCRVRLPQVTGVFEAVLGHTRPDRRERLRMSYDGLPNVDFSRDVLSGADGLMLRTWPASIGWSDLGTPERLARWRSANPLASSSGEPFAHDSDSQHPLSPRPL